MQPKRIVGVSLVLMAVGMLGESAAFAKDIQVRDPGDHSVNLQKVLDSAAEGDVIRVGPGIYKGNIVILPNNIKLIGDRFPVILGEKTGTVLTIKGSNCLVKGFIVREGGDDLSRDDSGIMFRECSHSVVEDCKFLDNCFGCYFYKSDDCIFRNNLIEGRKALVEEERGNGIHLWDAARYLIEGNEIRYARDGIYVSFANYGAIKGNWIHHTRYGLHYMYSKHNSFIDNLLTENVAGAAVMYSEYMKWNRNVFAHNRGFRAYGVLWQDARICECHDNLVVDNTIGLYFDQALEADVRGNMVIWNDQAAVLLENSELNTIYENNFLDNLSELQLRGGTQKGRNNEFYKGGQGNYWSDYRGYDLNGDGVGDVPHTLQDIFEYLMAGEPAYRLYLFSPAAQAMVIAEKAFPIIAVSKEAIDKNPLMKPVTIKEMDKLFEKLKKAGEHSSTMAKGLLMLFSLVIIGIPVLIFIRGNRVW